MQTTVALAHTADDETLIEKALDAAGIAYSEALEADEQTSGHAVCFLARGYAVDAERAADARRVLTEKGLGHCVTGSYQ